VRNFLMEMKVLRHDPKGGRYVLSRDHYKLYALAIEGSRGVSPDSFAEAMAEREAIGLLAEKEVVSFEKTRLGPGLAGEVDHVALRSVSAGYDIRSVTVTDRKELVPRYIEVKAVSPNSLRFHWTQNEILVAQALRESYFLYLLPMGADGAFDVSSLRMIPDPHKAVLGSRDKWVIETDVIRCYLRHQSAGLNETAESPHHV